jgi:hypothetical protein
MTNIINNLIRTISMKAVNAKINHSNTEIHTAESSNLKNEQVKEIIKNKFDYHKAFEYIYEYKPTGGRLRALFPWTTKEISDEGGRLYNNIQVADKRLNGADGKQFINPNGVHSRLDNPCIKSDVIHDKEQYLETIVRYNKGDWIGATQERIIRYQECINKLANGRLDMDCYSYLTIGKDAIKLICNIKGIYL